MMLRDHEQHLFWQYLPQERKTRKARWNLKLRRLLAWFGGRRQQIGLVTTIYLILWSIPLFLGEPLISLFAVLPLMLVPPVGLLVYRLVWQEFHE